MTNDADAILKELRRRDDELISQFSKEVGEVVGELRASGKQLDALSKIIKETRDIAVSGHQWQIDHDTKEEKDHKRIEGKIDNVATSIPEDHQRIHDVLHPVAKYYTAKVDRSEKRRAFFIRLFEKISENFFGKIIGWVFITFLGGIFTWLATNANWIGLKVLKLWMAIKQAFHLGGH